MTTRAPASIPAMAGPQASPMVSFIVPARDEERELPRCLDALGDVRRTLAGESELIVVDDGSTDTTAAIARQSGARVVSVEHRQIAATRNSGARVARGDVLVFVDADTRVSPRTARCAVRAVRNGAVGGGARVRFDRPVPLWGRVFERTLDLTLPRVGVASGSFLYASRAAFEAVGGFDETLWAAEELAFARALREHGPFEIVSSPVITSGRKLRTHSAREVLGTLLRLGLRPSALGNPDDPSLGVWYGPKRVDPRSDEPLPHG